MRARDAVSRSARAWTRLRRKISGTGNIDLRLGREDTDVGGHEQHEEKRARLRALLLELSPMLSAKEFPDGVNKHVWPIASRTPTYDDDACSPAAQVDAGRQCLSSRSSGQYTRSGTAIR